MATEIAKAYVQILPTTKDMKSNLTKAIGGDVSAAGTSAGESFGASLVGKLKGVLAAAGIGAILKETLEAGGALQQSFGGLDTLYGEASQAAKDYAREAASAGISMNDYAEQAVSFGASLKAAFEGDTTKAVEAANTAILDMADNAAKMGTPLESIQNAYQGFAKGQYNMLDNLKLGYGGTKTEMERLLADAEKLSGQKYDLDNLGDVYSAIHVIQEDLGLTGVAAEEASETFTGSFEAMKASATNLMADLATGNGDAIFDDIQNLMKGAETFVIDNMAPMVANILERVPQIIANLMYEIGDLLSQAAENADTFVEFGINFVSGLAEVIVEDIPYVISGIIKLVAAIGKALLEYDWIGLAQRLISSFKSSILDFASNEFGSDTGLLDTFIAWITDTFPSIVQSGIDLLTNLLDGIISALPGIVNTVLKVVTSFINTVIQNLPKIIEAGFKILTAIITGIIKTIPKLIAALPQVFSAIINAFKNINWGDIGSNIIQGVKNGILNGIGAIADAAKEAASSALNAAKNFLKIKSPSRAFRDQVGSMIPAGMAIGIESNISDVTDAMDELSKETLNSSLGSFDSYNYGNAIATSSQSTDIGMIVGLLQQYLPGLGNQQIVLDSGTLVGATASKMDVALGKIATNNQRGVLFA